MPSETVSIKAYIKIGHHGSSTAESKDVVSAKDDKITIVEGGKNQSFSFDGCYGTNVTAIEVYRQSLESTLQRALNGNNVTILVLGSNDSGKQNLTSGSEEQPGIGRCIVQSIFKMADEQKSRKKSFLSASFLQVDDDVMLDLLNPHSNEMKIKEHPQLGIYVDGLSELVAHSVQDLARLYMQGVRAAQMCGTKKSANVFTVNIEQKEHQASNVGLKASLKLITYVDTEQNTKSMQALKAVIGSLKSGSRPQYRESKITRVMQESLGGNSATLVYGCLSPSANQSQNNMQTIQLVRSLMGIKNTVKVNLGETSSVVSELRDEISRLRNKIVQNNSPDKDDVMKLQEVINDLNLAKQQSWEEKETLSRQYEEQRKVNLANKGILEWVLNSGGNDTKSHDEQVLLQKENDQVTMQYRSQKSKVDQIKTELQKGINSYTKSAGNEAQAKALLSSINEKKGSLRRETEKLSQLKQQLKAVQEKQKNKKASQDDLMFVKGNAELRQKVQKEEFDKMELEHEGLVKDEKERCDLELDHELIEIKTKYGNDKKKECSTAELIDLETQLATLKSDKIVIALQIQNLKEEKEKLRNDLQGVHKIHKEELEMQQLQHFQTFKQYREMFEAQKALLDDRYRSMLEESVQDAIYTSTKYNDLMVENNALKQEIAELKDKLSKS